MHTPVASEDRLSLSRLGSIRWFDPPVLFIAALGIWFRAQYIHLPMAEAHRWRAIFDADVARNFYERSMNIFYPQVNWGGADQPFVGMEFPLMPWLVAALYYVFGEETIIGRLVSMLFSVATVWAIAVLGTWMFNVAVGRAAAFLMAISPSAIFFGRFFISDIPMVCFSVLAMLGWVVYLDTGSRRACVWASVASALAFLVKLPAIMMLAPFAWAAWEAKRWGALKDRGLMIGMAAAVLAAGLWYWHADRIFHQTGLGVAIWHPSGSYPPPISYASGPFVTVSSWATQARLSDPAFYYDMLVRFWALHLTPAGFILGLFALFAAWRMPRRHLLDAWLGVGVLFILVTAEGSSNHEFHQMPMLPPAALLFGLVAAPAFDGRWLRENGGPVAGVLGSAATLLVVALLSFRFSGVVEGFFRPNMLDMTTIRAGHALSRMVDPNGLVVTVEYERFGNNSPILLYWMHRRGWSFDLAAMTPHVLQLMQEEYGARYFASTIWPSVEKAHPVVAAYLRTRKEVPLADAPNGTVLFDLTEPAAK